jgi:hypothetical protein
MAKPRIDLFCEDSGHEQFVVALVNKIAGGIAVDVDVRPISARGGHGRAIRELKAYQKALQTSRMLGGMPDLLVVVIDGNCKGWHQAHKAIASEVDKGVFARFCVGCPDPHVERWCMADPTTFARVIGQAPRPDPVKCERAIYKQLLRRSIEEAGHTIISDVMEFAGELVQAMDLYRAGRQERSLGAFVDELRSALASLAVTS